MKQTLNTFSHKTLAFTLLAASLSLPVFANAADVSAGVNASANVNADGAVSAVADSVKHTKHHLVKKATAAKEQSTEIASSNAVKVKTAAQANIEKVKTSAHTGAEIASSNAASVATEAKAKVAPIAATVVAPVEAAVTSDEHAPTPAANANTSTNLGIQTPVGSIGGGIRVGAGIR